VAVQPVAPRREGTAANHVRAGLTLLCQCSHLANTPDGRPGEVCGKGSVHSAQYGISLAVAAHPDPALAASVGVEPARWILDASQRARATALEKGGPSAGFVALASTQRALCKHCANAGFRLTVLPQGLLNAFETGILLFTVYNKSARTKQVLLGVEDVRTFLAEQTVAYGPASVCVPHRPVGRMLGSCKSATSGTTPKTPSDQVVDGTGSVPPVTTNGRPAGAVTAATCTAEPVPSRARTTDTPQLQGSSLTQVLASLNRIFGLSGSLKEALEFAQVKVGVVFGADDTFVQKLQKVCRFFGITCRHLPSSVAAAEAAIAEGPCPNVGHWLVTDAELTSQHALGASSNAALAVAVATVARAQPTQAASAPAAARTAGMRSSVTELPTPPLSPPNQDGGSAGVGTAALGEGGAIGVGSAHAIQPATSVAPFPYYDAAKAATAPSIAVGGKRPRE
jgi:hypothetical protein